MSRYTHMCLNLEGFLSHTPFPRGYVGVFKHDDGRQMTPAEARETMFAELRKGHRVIPCAPCDNFDYQTGCLGHDEPPGSEQ